MVEDNFMKTRSIEGDVLEKLRLFSHIVWFKYGTKYVSTFFLPVNVIGVVMMLIPVYSLKSSLTEIAKQTVLIVTDFQMVYKSIFFLWEFQRVMRMFNVVKTKFWNINSCGGKIQKSIEVNLKLIILICLSHVGIGYTGMVVIFCFPLVPYPEGRKQLPIFMWFPEFVDTENTYMHIFIYAFSTVNAFVSLSIMFSYDLLFVYFAQHLFTQISLLQEKYRSLCHIEGIYENYLVESKKCQKIIKNRLIYCTEHHALLLSFANDLNKMLSGVAFIQLGISTVTITFLSFCVTKESYFSITTFYMFSFLYSIMVQFFIYAHHGTELQENTKNISLSIYESQWHLFDVRLQKDVAFAVMGAQQEVCLTAGGYITISNKTLLQVFKSSFSYITLLLSLSK